MGYRHLLARPRHNARAAGERDPALVQHRSDEPLPGQDRQAGNAGRAQRAAGGSSRLAHLGAVGCARKHHQRKAAAQMPGALTSFASQTGRERLVIHAQQLALKPGEFWN